MSERAKDFDPEAVKICFDRPQDIREIIRVQSIAPWCKDRTEKTLDASISNSDIFVTAHYKDKIVGTAMVLTDYTFYAIVFDVIVDERLHSKGIGTKIMQAVQNHPRLLQVKKMYLFTRERQGFYQKLGWQMYPGNALYIERDKSA